VADLPGAMVLVHQWPGSALALLAAGGLWVALWQRPWRWLGIGPVGAAVALMILARPPDLLVDGSMGMAAVRGGDGQVVLVEWRGDRLVRESWLRHLGVAAALGAPRAGSGRRRGVACDESGCVADLGGSTVALAFRVAAVVEDCGRVDLVIARVGPERCRGGEMLGPRALRASGGLAVRRYGDRLEVRTVAESRGRWPWNAPQTYRLN
jgi:competence protein ComEC